MYRTLEYYQYINCFTVNVDASIRWHLYNRVLQKFQNNLEESNLALHSITPLYPQSKTPLTSQALQIVQNECYSGAQPT
jgi:hypothetical protein